MSNGSAHAESAIATYRVLRELGERSQRSYAALRGDGSLVVLHRFTRGAGQGDGERDLVSAEQMAIVLRDARCLAKNWHPNIARVRHVDLATDVLHVATELVDGVTLDELFTIANTRRAHPDEPALSHAIVARIFLDVLAGLSALHSLRDGINAPIDAFHGELCPANVVVGKDGVARIVNVFRPRPVKIRATSEALGYASPETLAGEVEQDARADIHAVGVMLWEALAERRLYDEQSPARIAQRQREEEIAPPNARLADVAMRALAFDPALRFRTAQEMAASVRAFAGTVASGSTVAQIVTDFAGERIRSRRADLDPQSSGHRPVGARLREVVSGAHACAPSDPLVAARPPSAPSLGTMSAREMRIVAPPPPLPDAASHEPRPLPPRHASSAPPAAPSRPSQRPVVLPLPGKATVSSLPPPDEDEDGLPGPRESTPDDEYLAQLATELRGPRSSSTVLDELDDDDGDALATAREVTLSTRAITPAPEARSAPPALPVPPPPHFPALEPASPPRAAARPDPPPPPRREPSTRTPFVVDVLPTAVVSTSDVEKRRRPLPRVALALAAALVLAGAGAGVIARSPAPDAPTTAAHEPDPPSTVIVTPPPVVESAPASERKRVGQRDADSTRERVGQRSARALAPRAKEVDLRPVGLLTIVMPTPLRVPTRKRSAY